MYRTASFSLAHLTAHKRAVLAALLKSYRAAVNFYIRSLWATPGKLDGETGSRLTNTRLWARYKGQALRQALGIVSGAREGAKALGMTAGMPRFSGGAELSNNVVSVDPAKSLNDFDIVVTISTLVKAKRIDDGPDGDLRFSGRLTIPLKATAPLRELLAVPGAQLLQGVNVSEDRVTLIAELPDVAPTGGAEVLGVDVGMHKLIATSEGQFLGTDFREITDKIRRRKRGSKGKRRALRERDQVVGEAVNKLPWGEFDAIGVEDLRGIKRGKRKGQSRVFRRRRSSWPARAVRERIERRAAEHGAVVVPVNPWNTSRRCPMCGSCDPKNRAGGLFFCTKCGYTNDADYVAARNIKTRAEEVYLGSPDRLGASPGATMAVASTHKTVQGDRVSPARASRSGLRGTGHSRSSAPASCRPGQGSGPVRGGHARPASVTSQQPLRSVESLGRRQPTGKTRRSE